MNKLNEHSAWLDLSHFRNVAIDYDHNNETLEIIEKLLNDWPHRQTLKVVIGCDIVIDHHHPSVDTLHIVDIKGDINPILIQSYRGDDR
jgi:hypothetical protein